METDFVDNEVLVYRNGSGNLMVQDEELGTVPLDSYHHGLTVLGWKGPIES